ncbi:hypothetical protein IE53DRAFT_152874 [Violaceomyces palustris]|uniref:Uncharacterized protein n=1 Tax=Violaceomyces palustris TaxID=1673888 RepID=A0ACD0NU10_9BASI|nr:hypothetical protein IE53DRAFT_152874 [Violaceomyces palustris]
MISLSLSLPLNFEDFSVSLWHENNPSSLVLDGFPVRSSILTHRRRFESTQYVDVPSCMIMITCWQIILRNERHPSGECRVATSQVSNTNFEHDFFDLSKSHSACFRF